MPTYKVQFKDEVICELDSEESPVRIGRSEECELRIDNLGISRFHAVIEEQGGIRVIKDLGSHNGLFFNGQPVKKRVLNDGDVFVIGKYRLEYKDDDTPGGGLAADSEDSGIGPSIDEMGMKTFAIDPGALALVQKSERVRGHLRRESDGKTIDLRQTITTFGKSIRCDYKIPGFFTPKVVAAVVRDERGFIVLNATGNPDKVKVQNRPLQMYVRLENGFQLTLGKVIYTFQSGRAEAG
jgi:predicted component of type VI protein secretion system